MYLCCRVTLEFQFFFLNLMACQIQNSMHNNEALNKRILVVSNICGALLIDYNFVKC